MTKEYVEERYNLLFELYGVQSRGWFKARLCDIKIIVWGDGTPKTIEQISYKEHAVIKPYLIKEGDYSPSIHN